MDEVGAAAPQEQQHDGESTSTTAVDSPSSAKRNRSSPSSSSSSNPQLKKAPLARMESAASMEIESEDEHHRMVTWNPNTAFKDGAEDGGGGEGGAYEPKPLRTVSESGPVRKRVYEGRSFRKRKRGSFGARRSLGPEELSEEVKKMAQGGKLTHFQALSLLHKVLAFSEAAREEGNVEEEEEQEEDAEMEVEKSEEGEEDVFAAEGPKEDEEVAKVLMIGEKNE